MAAAQVVREMVTAKSKFPIPNPGDYFEYANQSGKIYEIRACDCYSVGTDGWPHGNRCGAHLYMYGEYAGNIIYLARGEWLSSGSLIRSGKHIDTTSSSTCPEPELSRSELKEHNTSPEATRCSLCSGPLKKPFPTDPTYNHCPVCEP